jgi:hypothetical protein
VCLQLLVVRLQRVLLRQVQRQGVRLQVPLGVWQVQLLVVQLQVPLGVGQVRLLVVQLQVPLSQLQRGLLPLRPSKLF